jgi:hypothetical protein
MENQNCEAKHLPWWIVIMGCMSICFGYSMIAYEDFLGSFEYNPGYALGSYVASLLLAPIGALIAFPIRFIWNLAFKNRRFALGYYILAGVFLTAATFAILTPVVEREVPTLAKERSKVEAWGRENNALIKVDLNVARNYYRDSERTFGQTVGYRHYFFGFDGGITNNSQTPICGVLIDVVIFNKSAKKEVVRKRVFIPQSVFPTVTLKLNRDFSVATNEFYLSKEQLGDDYSWSYEYHGAVPKEYEFSVKQYVDFDLYFGE